MEQAPGNYQRIVIIYNPNSTSGTAEARARRLSQRLEKRGLKKIELIPTQHAGHAEEIAYASACAYERLLLVSVSGDGGYNEVINGALQADNETGHQTVCTILAAGNANDHRRSVRKQPLSRAIAKAQPEAVDILKMTARNGEKETVRYAHSYIGLGITSHVAAELNQTSLTRFKEASIVVRAFFNFEPLRVKFTNDRERKFDSIVFANVHHMAKVMRIGKRTNLKNGLFKVVIFPHQTRFKFIYTMIKTVIVGVRKPVQEEAMSFKIPRPSLIHLDGEIQELSANTQVTVEAIAGGLYTVR